MDIKIKARISKLLANENCLQAEKVKTVIVSQLDLFPKDKWLLIQLARAHRICGQLKQALLILRPIYKIDPQDPGILWEYACISMIRNQYKSALVYLRKALDQSLDDPELANLCIYKIGECFLMLDELEKALQWFGAYLKNCKRLKFSSSGFVEAQFKCLKKIVGLRKNNFPRLWTGLFRVKSKEKLRNAFTNGVVVAKSQKEAKAKFTSILHGMGFQIIKHEPIEEIDKRALFYQIPIELRKLAIKANKSDSAVFGAFVTWKK